ncbi:MAG: IMP dehydrogenase, partial [Phycisphaerae bacterium]|nr:IMP dehydrogenase [Phycisphaerae bacterium]
GAPPPRAGGPRAGRGAPARPPRAPPPPPPPPRRGPPRDAEAKKIKFVPEGVEGLVAYRGTLAEFVYQMVGGLRASMGYCGCNTLPLLQRDARFCRISPATVVENHPHNIRITKESPNYLSEAMGE